MRVKTIEASGFKGQSFSHELGPVTALLGRNRVGKTARLEALAFALCGCVPWLRTEGGTPLRDTGDLLAELSSPARPFVKVKATMDTGQSVARVLAVQGKSAKRSDAWDGLPVDWALPALALDADEWLGLSGPDRARLLFERADAPDLKLEAVRERVLAALRDVVVEEPPQTVQPVVDELVLGVKAMKHAGALVQEWIGEVVDELTEQKRVADQNVRRLRQTGQGLAQVAGDASAPQDAEAVLEKARNELAAAMAKSAVLDRDLKQCRADWKAEKLKASTKVDPAALAAAAKLVAGLAGSNPADAVRLAEGEAYVARQLVTDAQLPFAKAEFACQALNGSPGTSGDTCATCGQKIAKKTKDAARRVRAAALKAAEGALEAARSVLHSAQVRAANAEARAGEARQVRDMASDARQIVAAAKERDGAEGRALALDAKGKAMAGENGALQAAIPALREAVAAADVAYKRLVAVRAERRAMASAAQEAARSRAEAAVLKAALAMLRDLAAQMTAKAVGPLLERANALCMPVLGSALELRDGEVLLAGIGKRGLSGSEGAVVRCALSVALAAGAPVRIAALDELNHLDPEAKNKFVHLLVSLVADGKLDQAVVVDNRLDDYSRWNGGNQVTVISI